MAKKGVWIMDPDFKLSKEDRSFITSYSRDTSILEATVSKEDQKKYTQSMIPSKERRSFSTDSRSYIRLKFGKRKVQEVERSRIIKPCF